MNTIKLILAESGQICDLKKDFPLYVGSYQNKLLNVLVPTSIIAPKFIQYFKAGNTQGTYTAVKAGMRYLKRDGNYQKTSDYYMNYLKNIVVNNVEYAVFERKLPKDFTLFEGQGQNAPKLIVNVVNILVENDLNSAKVIEIITSQVAALDVMYSSELNNEPDYDPTDMELLSSKVNALIEEMPKKSDLTSTMLKYNVATVPRNVVYNKDGYKTIGVLFTDEQFLIKTTLTGEEELVRGSIMATYFSGSIQTEIFNYGKGIAVREIILNTDLETTSVGEWFVQVGRKQRPQDAEKFLFIDEFGNVSVREMIIPEEIDIVDNLDSDRANASLAARQGKILKGLIDNVVESLKNYYLKTETYSKEETNQLIGQIPKFNIEVVTSLPTENISMTTVYLLKTSETETSNLYTEYIYVNGVWEKLGTQKLDLSNYPTIGDMNVAISTALANYYTKTEIDDLINEVQQDIDTTLGNVAELHADFLKRKEDVDEELNNRAKNDDVNSYMLGVPSNNNHINISATTFLTEYTAPSNGYISYKADTNTTDNCFVNLTSYEDSSKAKRILVNTCFLRGASNESCNCFLPVKKGNHVSIHATWNFFSAIECVFVPCEEVE